MGAMVKGTVAKAGHDYMREAYGEVTWQRMLEMLPADDRVLVQRIASVMHYPVALDGKLFEALVHVQFEDNLIIAEQELRKGGAYQADIMLDGFFSVFARFVSPQQAFRRAGSIITSIYSSDVTSRTNPAADANGGAIHVLGLGESSFISPWHCGWVERGITRFGGINAHVSERSWDAGQRRSDELIYDTRWG